VNVTGDHVEVEGTRVFVHRRGSGPPVVLMHGYMMSHVCFAEVTEQLSQQFEVFAVDLPGFGQSDRPPATQYSYTLAGYTRTVSGLLDRLGLARPALVGHSLGGRLAVEVAFLRPERVRAVVPVCAPAAPFNMPSWLGTPVVHWILWQLFSRAYTRAQFGRDLARIAYGREYALVPERVDYLWSQLQGPGGHEAAWNTLVWLSQLEPVAGQNPGDVPALVIWGENDVLVPMPHGKRLAAALGAPLRVIPATGHSPHEERPGAFLKVLVPFLEATCGSTRLGVAS
jgi:pimeloyl-ACP methyl ester carboxylesterase